MLAHDPALQLLLAKERIETLRRDTRSTPRRHPLPRVPFRAASDSAPAPSPATP